MRGLLRVLRAPFLILGRRIRLPLIHRSVPLWLLLAVGGPPLLFAGGAAVVATNQPVFCSSCHEMDLHYATWQRSSHRGVACEECHVMPGMVSMFSSKLAALKLVKRHAAGDVRATAIQGHVPNANCERCHTSTQKLITYHGLKITHQAHWKMGVDCTFCHDRVVHGPKWLYTGVTSEQKRPLTVSTAYTFTPAMETCFKCHDGRKAPNTCTTCHVSLGERRPSAFDPAWVEAHQQEVKRTGQGACERCHTQDFCQNCHRSADPHRGDWIARHPDEARKDASGCYSCHLAPAEHRPTQAQDMAFCRACHGLRREHKQADWGQVHGKESLADPEACQKCHTSDWCASCHSITRPHPQEWLARHPAEATRDPGSCQLCHKQQFCDSCHKSKQPPPSHTSDSAALRAAGPQPAAARSWLAKHGDSAQAASPGCSMCHTPDFCQKCHAMKPPASHSKQWLDQHGAVSRLRGTSCLLCHQQSFCNKCHQVIMPHPKEWLKQHPTAGRGTLAASGAERRAKEAARERQVCTQCHGERSCETCHRGALPGTHAAKDWMSRHGTQAKQAGAQCTLCHRSDFCTSCHGTQIPHPADWSQAAHGQEAQAHRNTCLRCHQEADCAKCHGLQLPHPDDWLTEHGKQAATAADTCSRCHHANQAVGRGRAAASGAEHRANDCNSCHAALAPSSHSNADWEAQHGVVGSEQMALCGLCHGEDACNACHAKQNALGGKTAKSGPSGPPRSP